MSEDPYRCACGQLVWDTWNHDCPGAPGDRCDELERRIEALEERIEALEARQIGRAHV